MSSSCGHTTLSPEAFPKVEAWFSDHTMALFAKHGLKVVNFWVALDDAGAPTDTLVYVLEFPNRQAATDAWAAFQSDPDWKAAKAASETDGPIVASLESTFLVTTDFFTS